MAFGLMAACATIVIGIINGCEPETVLYRGLVAGGAVTVIASIVRSLWELVDPGGSA